MIELERLTTLHGYRNSVSWRLCTKGLEVGGLIERTRSQPATVRLVWKDFREAINHAALEFEVPVELIIATICTETRGDPAAVRTEPGYVSDRETPHRVSPGLMQTLISTARSALGDKAIDRAWLLRPENSIRAGTAYIANQARKTRLDPPVVAAAYNSGSVYHQKGRGNRWKMRQYPIGTGEHVDRFVRWFNDCFTMFALDQTMPVTSFYMRLNFDEPPEAPDEAQPKPGFWSRVFSCPKGD